MDKIGTPIPKQYLAKSLEPIIWDWRYEILHEVGFGTYGSVFKAYDSINKEYVAIKVVDMHDKTADDCQICAKNIFTEIEKLEAIINSPIVYGKSRIGKSSSPICVYTLFDLCQHSIVTLIIQDCH